MQEWNKTISYNFITDYNVDKTAHILLFLMAKNGLLSDYIIDLVSKDIETNYKNVINDRFCEQLALKEMGYFIKENDKAVQIIEKIISVLNKKNKKRFSMLEEEKNNVIAQKYAIKPKSINEENKQEQKNAETPLKESTSQQVFEKEQVKYDKSIEEIERNPKENEALTKIAGL